MAVNDKSKNDTTLQTPVQILNQSFDQEAQVLVTENLVYNPTTENLDRLVQPATSIDQATLISLVETLQELSQRLAPLAGAMANTASLRVTGIAMPSTAVTGPMTSAQSIAEKNAGGVMYGMRVSIDNNTAIQSNINNCTIN